jgi:N-acetylglucosaminyl-diphospho-decaprenol L-rhamnosyltransferase
LDPQPRSGSFRIRALRMMQQVAILIVGYRCAADIRKCLDALGGSTHTAFAVHICENGGPEAYQQLLDELAMARLQPDQPQSSRAPTLVEVQRAQLASGQSLFVYRASGNLGYAGALNAMIKTIEFDPTWSAVWILNPDTTIDPDALHSLVAYAQTGPYGIVGSRLVSAESGKIDGYAGRWRKWMARGFNIGLGRPSDDKPDTAAIERLMDYVSGAAMYVTRSFIADVGLMDERYFLYNEEVDWCFRKRAHRLGYDHSSIVYHRHGATIGSSHDRKHRSPLSVYLDERNKLLFTRRFFPSIYPLVLAATLALTAQYLVAGAWANFGHALRGWFDGLLGRDGRPDWLLPQASAPGAGVSAQSRERLDPIPAGRDQGS